MFAAMVSVDTRALLELYIMHCYYFLPCFSTSYIVMEEALSVSTVYNLMLVAHV